MERLSDLISKKIISLSEGEEIGYILDVDVNTKNLEINGFLVCDEESEQVRFLDIKNINAINDFVTINSCNMLDFCVQENNNPIGKEVITSDGLSLGIVIDAEIKNKKIVKLYTKNGEINPKLIFNFGKCLMFSAKKRKKIENNAFPKLQVDSKISVKIQNKEEKMPYKSTISANKLIGKIATNDIFGSNREIIIRKNEVITEKIIKNAKKHNKLNNLIFNCK